MSHKDDELVTLQSSQLIEVCSDHGSAPRLAAPRLTVHKSVPAVRIHLASANQSGTCVNVAPVFWTLAFHCFEEHGYVAPSSGETDAS
jgi:hypothetical protein